MRNLLCSLLFLITLFFGNNLILVCSQCDSSQHSLLLQLKKHLIFDSSFSTKLVKWNQSENSWDGVTCEKGRVTGLDLTDEWISAGVEDSSPLFNFHYLKTLNLALNQFNGSRISYRFGNLTNLSYLNLSGAGFKGQIPIGISHLTNLITLDLSGPTNSQQLEVPNLAMLVQNFTKLEELYLDNVNILAHGNEWGKALSSALPNLRVLSLFLCGLSGPIDSSLSQLEYLSSIHLGNNHFSGPVPNFFANFSNLAVLDLSSCELYGIFPQQIFQVFTLHTIDLSGNQMLYGSLPEFSQNGSLQTLMLDHTSFSGILPESIGKLEMLTTIELWGCNFSGPIPISMSNLTRLVHVGFSDNNFTGPMPSFSASRNLTHLYLAGNLLHGSIDSIAWESLLNLRDVSLNNNSFSGSIPLTSLFKITSLQRLILSYNQFTALSNVSSHMSCYSLKQLDLSSNKIQGQFPDFVFTLQGLEILDLSFNNFSDIVQLDMVRQLKNLSNLDLSYNRLSINANSTDSTLPFPQFSTLYLAFCKLGSFPNFLKSMSTLAILDLSNNQIHGEIPKWIWKLPNLYNLNLSHNFLTNAEGPIPILSSLWVLDLHSNMFQGSIPILPKDTFYLDYSHNNLTCVIPTDIGDYLSSSSFLSLSSNNFHGSIPHSICNSVSLTVLLLSNNNLSGLIPPCLTTLSSLGVLNLRKNNFIGNIPDTFGNCGLQTLDVNGNMLEGKLPKSLANCTSLEVLDLGNNDIHDTFPCYLRNIFSLLVLVLRSNKFSGYINCSWYNVSWSRLQIVDLASNNFSGKLPEELLGSWKAIMVGEDKVQEKLKQVQFKVIGHVYYEDNVTITSKGLQMEFVKILTLFTSVDLSCNNFHGSIPEVIGEFKSLHILNLSHNALTGQIPSSIGNMKQLGSLDLSRNQINGEIPTQLASLNSLSVLDLSFNQLVGRIPQCLTTMSSLGVLNLRKNNFNGIISDTFDKYCILQTLNVNGNMLEGKLPKSLANCTGLEVLDFGNNNIHDTFPCYLKNISNLRVLVLRSNKFSGLFNCSWYNVNKSRLQIVDIASNNFSGKLPEEWLRSWKAMMVGEDNAREKLKQVRFEGIGPVYYENSVTITNKGMQMELVKILTLFTSIDFSCNNFNGSIPEVIKEFKSLHILNLSHNALTGKIPSSIENMNQLESLDLSRNQLNGEIPTQLASLNFLSVLDLSFNQLVGRIPIGTQLQSFPKAAFQGNARLYGCPLTDDCTNTREIKLSPRTSEDSKNEINCELVGAEIGFVVGFGIIILPLMFWKRWRYHYYKHVDQLLFRIFPQLDAGSRNHGRRVQTRF